MKHFLKSLVFAAILLVALPAHAADTPRAAAWHDSHKAGVRYAIWSGLDGDDTGIPINTAQCAYITVEVYSAAYGSSTVTFEGSSDILADGASYASANWVGLTDPQGTAFSKTGNAIEAIEEHPLYVRPKTASGTAASVSVALTCIEQR